MARKCSNCGQPLNSMGICFSCSGSTVPSEPEKSTEGEIFLDPLGHPAPSKAFQADGGRWIVYRTCSGCGYTTSYYVDPDVPLDSEDFWCEYCKKITSWNPVWDPHRYGS
jgi:hypothetical protein